MNTTIRSSLATSLTKKVHKTEKLRKNHHTAANSSHNMLHIKIDGTTDKRLDK